MKRINCIFIAAVCLLLLAGLARTILFPLEINTYENRYAAQLPPVSVSGYLSGETQDAVDAALMDQIPGAQSMKSLYNRCTTHFLKNMLDICESNGAQSAQHYVDFNGMRLFGGDYIVYYPRYVESVQAELDAKIIALNNLFAGYPEIPFYTYYIEKDTDLDFETLVKTNVGEYLLSQLNLPEEHKGIFRVDSFAQYAEQFYKTDAHWNGRGAYSGYLELLNLLGVSGQPLQSQGDEILVSTSFSGKKAAAVAAEGVITEDFYAWRFAFPPMEISVNGQPGGQYGHQEEYFSGTAADPISYGGFYGDDNGETVFTGGHPGGGRILVIGDSFDNAVLQLLASHYDALYSIDLRYYEYSMGHPFAFADYMAQNSIDRVLLIGNIDYYIQDIFDPEG